METLSEMFELEIPTVHSIISKMIINEELMVSVLAYLFSQSESMYLIGFLLRLHMHKF